MELQKSKTQKNHYHKNNKNGGLNMLDFTLFDNALKIVWVKRLCAKDERLWKLIPLSLLSNAVFFFSATITFNIYPLMKTYQNSIISHCMAEN